MTVVEEDIWSTPTILRQTLARIDEVGDDFASLLKGPVVFLGCGSSYCVAASAAALYEEERSEAAQGIIASDYHARATWTHVGISRTGRSSELVDAMRRAHEAGARVLLIRGEGDSPAEAEADAVLPLEFAPEAGVIQTRFITAALLALRVLIGGVAARRALDDLPARVEQGLATLDTTPLVSRSSASVPHAVFLGRGWRQGVAAVAALNQQETALLTPEAHQTLDYRHGPIACADAETLVWCFDPLDDAACASVIDDVRKTGATVRYSGDDPLVGVTQAQLLAVRLAALRGIDADAPRHLTRAIVLPSV